MNTEHTEASSSTEGQHAVGSQVERRVRPTHWMDDRGFVVADEWLQGPEATSDYRAAYVIPARMTRAGARPMYPCRTCSGTGELDDGDACHDCGGSGGLAKPAVA